MKKRLIITGAGGFVAGSVVRQAGKEWEVHALARREAAYSRKGLFWHLLDLCDFRLLREKFNEISPDAVIHAAAAADIDFCEKNRAAAEAINVGVTKELAQLCADFNTRLVHISTDTVFDGEKGNYRETDPPAPVNYYGETKVNAETAVTAEAENAVVARIALVMGLPVLGAGNSFLSRMIAALEEGRETGSPDYEIRTPVDVITLGRAFLELAKSDFQGIIHLAGNDCMNRVEMGWRIARRLGYPPELVVVKNSSDMPGRAPRPRDVSLDNTLARSVLKTPMLGLDDALDLVISFSKNPGK